MEIKGKRNVIFFVWQAVSHATFQWKYFEVYEVMWENLGIHWTKHSSKEMLCFVLCTVTIVSPTFCCLLC